MEVAQSRDGPPSGGVLQGQHHNPVSHRMATSEEFGQTVLMKNPEKTIDRLLFRDLVVIFHDLVVTFPDSDLVVLTNNRVCTQDGQPIFLRLSIDV